MKDVTADFFDQVSKHGHYEELEKAKGLVRIDVKDNGRSVRWFVQINKGDVSVSHKSRAADCVLQTDKAEFARVVTGRENAMAAMLRGAIAFEGDAMLLVLFQRLMPAGRETRTAVAQGSRR